MVARWAGLSLLIATAFAGCRQGTTPSSSAPAPSGGASAKPSAVAAGIPPELVQKVEALIRLNGQYCAMAEKVQDATTFKQHWDELSRIERESSSVTEDIMIAENKLTPQQRGALDRDLFTPRAKPSIDQQRQQKARVMALAP
jgi:hypothetical protein